MYSCSGHACLKVSHTTTRTPHKKHAKIISNLGKFCGGMDGPAQSAPLLLWYSGKPLEAANLRCQLETGCFPCFAFISAVYWGSWNPDSPFVLFDSHIGPFYTPKHYILKGIRPIFTQKYCKTGGVANTKRKNGSIFTMYGGGQIFEV